MIALIAAYTKNRVIGRNGQIPWSIRNEKKRFKQLTTGNYVIMGRKTFEEIGRPLPDRTTIVLTSNGNFDDYHCMTAESLEAALSLCEGKNIYISGGSEVYKAALPLVEKMYITEIDAVIEGDIYFPEFDENLFVKTVEASFDEELPYRYVTYTRIKGL